MEFEWNENKVGSTFQKHGVTFDEAKTVFDDSLLSVQEWRLPWR